MKLSPRRVVSGLLAALVAGWVVALAPAPQVSAAAPGTLVLVAGSGDPMVTAPGDGGPARAAHIEARGHMAVDAAGNLYFAECYTNRVRVVNPSGIISTFAGNGGTGPLGDGGPAAQAGLSCPSAVGLGPDGALYIADSAHFRIRKVDTGGTITTVAGNGWGALGGDGGPATSAQLYFPLDMTFDGRGNLYIADFGNNRVRKVDPTGVITTLAGRDTAPCYNPNASLFGPQPPLPPGTGPTCGAAGFQGDGDLATSALLSGVGNVAADQQGNVYVDNSGSSGVRKVDTSGYIVTVAGGGPPTCRCDGVPATDAQVGAMQGLALDGAGNLFLAEGSGMGSRRVRKVDPRGIISAVAGTGEVFPRPQEGTPALSASMVPTGLGLDALGNLFVSTGNQVWRVEGVAGAGPPRTTSPQPAPCFCPGQPRVQTAAGRATFAWGPLTDEAGTALFPALWLLMTWAAGPYSGPAYPDNTYSYGVEITSAPPTFPNNSGPDPARIYAAPSHAYGTKNGSASLTASSTQMGLVSGQTYYARVIAWSNWAPRSELFVGPHFVGVFGPTVPFTAP